MGRHIYEKKPYVAHTDFGKAVAESNFGRVCPKCGTKWSSKECWINDTVSKEKVETTAGFATVREHKCGGQMLSCAVTT